METSLLKHGERDVTVECRVWVAMDGWSGQWVGEGKVQGRHSEEEGCVEDTSSENNDVREEHRRPFHLRADLNCSFIIIV